MTKDSADSSFLHPSRPRFYSKEYNFIDSCELLDQYHGGYKPRFPARDLACNIIKTDGRHDPSFYVALKGLYDAREELKAEL